MYVHMCACIGFFLCEIISNRLLCISTSFHSPKMLCNRLLVIVIFPSVWQGSLTHAVDLASLCILVWRESNEDKLVSIRGQNLVQHPLLAWHVVYCIDNPDRGL